MLEENDISVRTWTRSVDGIRKDGYSDGVVVGMNATYQQSFDMGYSQGLKFGFELGSKEAIIQQSNITIHEQLIDARKINCQMCLENNTDRKNIGNLYNIQKEKNDDYLKNTANYLKKTANY